MVVKISAIQKRLNSGVKKIATTELAEGSPSTKKSMTTKPTDKHIVWMGLSAAYGYNAEGYAVISIGDHNRQDMPKFGDSPTLYLNFNPTFEREHWINKEHRSELIEFIGTNKDLNILIHCQYGSQRSAGIANGYYDALVDNGVEDIPLYKYESGLWTRYGLGGLEIYDYDNRCYSVGYDVCRKLFKKE